MGIPQALKAAKHNGVLVVISLECIGGCGWQHVNVTKEGGPARIEQHRKKFKRMLKHAEHVSRVATEAGGTIWFELGNSNSYWKDPAVVNYCENGLHGNY